MDEYLMHHGVLGQKWGVRRFQNKDGSLTTAGKQKYRTDRTAGHIGRAITNTSLGQRIWGVGTNRGFRDDLKEINTAYKTKRDQYKNDGKLDADKRREKMKTLKEDYKKTIGEARVTAANALYPWQSKSANEKIQTQNLGKQVGKSLLMGGLGTLTYDRLSSDGVSKGKSAAAGVLVGLADAATARVNAQGILGIGAYAYEATSHKKK